MAGAALPVTHVAFAPTGTTLAVATPNSVRLGAKKVVTGEVQALGWLKGRLAVAVRGFASDVLLVFAPNEASHRASAAHGFVAAVTPSLVVVRNGPKVFAGRTALLTVPRNATLRDLQVG